MPNIRTNSKSVLYKLYQREIGPILTKSCYRLSLKIVREIVADKNTTFKKVWEYHSQEPISCEDGKLYFNNFKTCYTLCGKNCLPSCLYKLDPVTLHGRVEDAIMFSGQVFKFVTSVPASYKRFLMTLSSTNVLTSYDNEIGQALQSVYIGPLERSKFRHLDWERHGETIVVLSTLNPAASSSPGKSRILVVIAWFSVFPLQFIAMLEIDREVFGKECSHCNVSEGLLILGTGSSDTGSVRLYDFTQMVDEGMLFSAKLGEPCDDLGGGRAGFHPYGLPVNCIVKEAPPLLFQVKCTEYTLHFGGFPFQYITTPPRRVGTFHVKSVASDTLVKNGVLDFPITTTKLNSIAFHPDDSGRIIHTSSHAIRCFNLIKDNDDNITLIPSFEIRMINPVEPINNFIPGKRISQRNSKRRFSFEEICAHDKSIMSEDYENELDLFGVLGIPTAFDNNDGRIQLYDSDSGCLLKTIDLHMKLEEFSEYTLTMDLEMFIILSKNECRNYSCYIYRLESPTVFKTDTNRKRRCKK